MKKSVISILVLILLMLAVAGCGETGTTSEPGFVSSTQNGSETPTENTPDFTQEDSDGVFKHGVIEMEYSMFGMKASSVTYYRGEDYRTVIEADTTDTPTIMIYLKNEDATYRFNEGTSKGDKILGTLDDDMDFLQEGVSLYTAVLEAKSVGEPITITDETLDGEPVKYIHGTYTDEEEGESAIVEMWYSEKYRLPLKYEITSAGMSVMALTVTDIRVDNSLANDLFIPPSDIEFVEFDPCSYIDNFLDFDYSSIDEDRDMSDFGDVD